MLCNHSNWLVGLFLPNVSSHTSLAKSTSSVCCMVFFEVCFGVCLHFCVVRHDSNLLEFGLIVCPASLLFRFFAIGECAPPPNQTQIKKSRHEYLSFLNFHGVFLRIITSEDSGKWYRLRQLSVRVLCEGQDIAAPC